MFEVSNYSRYNVLPGDILGWTENNLTGQVAATSTASSIQGWTVDLPANGVTVGSIFGPNSSTTKTNTKYALAVHILLKSQVIVNFTFTEPGYYNITLSLRNIHGSVVKSQEILVQHPITDLALLLPEFVLSRRTIKLKVHMTRGTNVSFIWDLGEGTNKTTFNQKYIKHQYNNTGRYIYISPFSSSKYKNVV